MLGAIFIGLSGMNAYSKGLQTISNNVANLNTAGFKSTSVMFADLYNTGGTGGLSYLGSTYGQHGGGVRIGSSFLDFGQGDLRQTDNDLDLGIEGSGMLVLMKDDKTFYTRTGQFAVDKDGYISEQGTGYHLAVLDASGLPVALNIASKRVSPPAATTKIELADNLLASSTTPVSVSGIAVYDSRGGKQVWTVTFTKDTAAPDPNTWTVDVKDSSGSAVGIPGTVKFVNGNIDLTTALMTVTGTSSGEPLTVTLDMSDITYFSASASSVRASSVDGNGVGALATVSVDDDGQIKLAYSNEKTELVGAVALADFQDPQSLKQLGGALFRNDGSDVRYRASGIEGVGKIAGKRIEASNVNLSDEFGDLILVQRGFQACSQVVSVSNDMIQQLFGIRGQG